MTTPEKIGLAELDVQNTLAHHLAAYTNGMALRQIHADRKQQVLNQLQSHPTGEALHIPRTLAHPYHLSISGPFAEFVGVQTLLEISEASDAFKEAVAIVQPLIDKVRELEAQLVRELEEHGVKLAALRDAEDAVTAKAQALLEKDPTVQKLRADIAASKPAHLEDAHPMPKLIRGRIELPATV